jgi:multidrug efflux pump subunit AcrA (membrane-fusion protein)
MPAATARAEATTAGGDAAAGAEAETPAAPPPPAIVVPAGVVIDRDGKTIVFEVVDDRARVRGVVVGGSRDGRTVVRQGLTGNETLVLNPSASLKDGDRVRVRG